MPGDVPAPVLGAAAAAEADAFTDSAYARDRVRWAADTKRVYPWGDAVPSPDRANIDGLRGGLLEILQTLRARRAPHHQNPVLGRRTARRLPSTVPAAAAARRFSFLLR